MEKKKSNTFEHVVRLFEGNFHPDGYNWKNVCSYHTLSEDFIRQWAHKIDWEMVKKYQLDYLSDKFKREFRDKFGL